MFVVLLITAPPSQELEPPTIPGRFTTGSTVAMQGMLPTMARDSVALAIRNGEITQDDVANGGLNTALGFAPSDAMIAAAMTPDAAPAQAAAVAPVAAPAAPVVQYHPHRPGTHFR